MAKKLVKNYSFKAGVGLDANIHPNAYSLISQNKTFIIKEIVAFIQNKVDEADPDYVGYTYSEAKCERDSGFVIDALLHDLRYGGNEEIRRIAGAYWDGAVAQVDGNRIPEYEAYTFAISLINTYVITNTADTTPEQAIELQVIDLTKTAEGTAAARVTTLLGNVVDVITNGLSSLPVEDIQLGRIEVLGKIELEDLLLISNVTDNVVIYNFSDPSKGGTTSFVEGNTESYPNATTVNNGVTLIRFKFDTSSMSNTDNIQIFLENTELRVRPYDFGTDAIERMRVAQPQAMLDADFEYGLQPTKWQAIGMQRGYPATYEVSATDVQVVSVTTDASTGTGGIGSSLITVTTQNPHGFLTGQPITIRALAASITGFARAEGTFLIFSVPSTTTFTYYAKAKVGTSNGQVLATTTTQLRQAAFYTGASIGQPTFSVFSNGSSGSFTTALRSESGTNTLSFIGAVPPIGAPLTGTGINTGTQVTGSFGPASSDGIVDYRFVKTTASEGFTSIELVNVNDLSANMALGNGESPNLLREITSIVGNTLNLSGSVEASYTGDEEDYFSSATPVVTTGTSATVTITVLDGVYTLDSIDNGGSGYAVGDTIRVLGSNLGGANGSNDALFNVDTVSTGAITGLTLISGSGGSNGTYSAVATQGTGSQGSGVFWTIRRSAGSYSIEGFGPNTMTNYFVGNTFSLAGTELGGTSPANDVLIAVTTVAGTQVTGASASGTAIRGDQIPVYATITISENTTAIVPATTTINYSAIATIQIDFSTNHGLVPGMGLNVAIGSTGTNHQLASGPFSVEQIIDSNTIRYIARSAGTVDTTTALIGTVYARPDSFFSHRPFDGGVQLGTGGPQHGGQAIRQSKKYIRYQSGKGAMYNTGALFAPSFDVRSITASSTSSGALITVITDDVDHGVQAGAVIKLSGVDTTGYNGTYTVSEVVDERTFRVVSNTQLGSTTGIIGSQCQMALVNWHGAVVRSGPFDDQNGIFFQYDGQILAVGRRTSTFQCAGTISINTDSNSITGANTRFLDQLQEGDRIVIRGMTHVVAKIDSNTAMTVTPDFRGVSNVSGVKICKVQDIIIPQSEWNLDKCDGTGPSGYNIDVTKMQMIGIQFSWYGAGFIDWMFRGPEGNYVFCHRLKGNNLNTEAYMRTGNAPVRYEVLNEGARSRLNGAINDIVTSIPLDDITLFPESGTVYVDNELISFSGKSLISANGTAGNLTGCTRGASLSNFSAGAVRTYTAGAAASHNDNQGVILVSCTTSPIISHWGSAYLIDGNFDEDRGYIFNYAATGINISTTKATAFLIRLAPSVSNAVTGDLGERELLNRAQLLLNAITITSETSTGGIVIEGVLNPQNYPTDPSKVTWQGLSGAAQGGQPSFAQIASGGSIDFGASSTTTAITTQGTMTGSITIRNINYWGSNRSINSGSNFVFLRSADIATYLTQGLVVGVGISGTGFAGGTTVTNIVQNWSTVGGTQYGYIFLSQNANANVTGDVNRDVTLSMRTSATNLFFFQTSSWVSSGAKAGQVVSDALFPANTTVSSATAASFFSTNYYRVIFNQSSNATTINPGTTTVTMIFGVPGYALPGEQIFSFIASPGGTETLELNQLKELGTTSIGGRGAFPNGPDVLAINVYKVSGSAVASNIILRWGEAQA